jgi:hypothetical protein
MGGLDVRIEGIEDVGVDADVELAGEERVTRSDPVEVVKGERRRARTATPLEEQPMVVDDRPRELRVQDESLEELFVRLERVLEEAEERRVRPHVRVDVLDQFASEEPRTAAAERLQTARDAPLARKAKVQDDAVDHMEVFDAIEPTPLSPTRERKGVVGHERGVGRVGERPSDPARRT